MGASSAKQQERPSVSNDADVYALLRRVVFGVSPTDPAILASAVLMPMLVALIACWLPARRAAATNPVEALRQSP